MRIWENPPVRLPVKRRRHKALRRGPGGRFLKAAATGRKSMARKRHKSRTKVASRKRRSSKRRGGKHTKAWYAAIGRKGAAARKRKKAARSRAAKKAYRSSHRKRRPRYRARGKKLRPTVYRRRGKYYASPGSRIKGRRINPRRRRRSGRRSNPGFAIRSFFPTSMGDFKNLAVVGAGGATGWLGVSAVNTLLDKVGVGTLKAKIESPAVMSLVNAAQSAVSTFIVAGLVRTFVKKPEFTKAVFIGGAAKTVHSLVVPYLAKAAGGTGMVAQAADAALSGFQEQEMGGFQERLGGFQERLSGNALGYVADGLQAVALANAEGAGNAFGV